MGSWVQGRTAAQQTHCKWCRYPRCDLLDTFSSAVLPLPNTALLGYPPRTGRSLSWTWTAHTATSTGSDGALPGLLPLTPAATNTTAAHATGAATSALSAASRQRLHLSGPLPLVPGSTVRLRVTVTASTEQGGATCESAQHGSNEMTVVWL